MTDTKGELELDVLRVAHGGVFVAELEGRVVFVPDVVPGERVHVRIVDDRHPSFLRAVALDVVRASPDRQPHVWGAASIEVPAEDRAGGAEFGHIAPARQRALKGAVIQDALGRIGRMSAESIARLDPVVRPVRGREDGTGSRSRVRLHAGGGGRFGPYAARSRRTVTVPDLPLATPAVERAALAYRGRGRAIDVLETSTGVVRTVVGASSGTVTEQVGERAFVLEAGGFWQVHPAAAETLTAAVREAAASPRFDPAAPNLDLYGGVGLFAAALADLGGADTRVATVEADRAASRHAAANLADLGAVRAIAARTEEFLAAEPPGAGATVVLDPPRSGAGAAVVDALADSRAAQVVYVACDPVAFARDAARFAQHGWGIQTISAFDLFPNTHHVELVATLVPGFDVP